MTWKQTHSCQLWYSRAVMVLCPVPCIPTLGAHHRRRPVSVTMIERDCCRGRGRWPLLQTFLWGSQASPHTSLQPSEGRQGGRLVTYPESSPASKNADWQLRETGIAWPRLIEGNIFLDTTIEREHLQHCDLERIIMRISRKRHPTLERGDVCCFFKQTPSSGLSLHSSGPLENHLH